MRTHEAPREADVDVRVVKALAHPTRVRILGLLRGRELVSPIELSTELGMPLGTVGYHVRRLEELGFIELAKETKRRGATEHHYRARTLLDEPADATVRPRAVGDAGAAALRIADEVQDALARGGFDTVAALTVRRLVTLDGRGRAALRAAARSWEQALARIERESGRRLAAAQAAPRMGTAVVLLFDAPPDAT